MPVPPPTYTPVAAAVPPPTYTAAAQPVAPQVAQPNPYAPAANQPVAVASVAPPNPYATAAGQPVAPAAAPVPAPPSQGTSLEQARASYVGFLQMFRDPEDEEIGPTSASRPAPGPMPMSQPVAQRPVVSDIPAAPQPQSLFGSPQPPMPPPPTAAAVPVTNAAPRPVNGGLY